MLIDFKTNNYKSFKNGFDFDMRATRVRDLKDSVMIFENVKQHRILPTSVIYGPNAAGKTSIINALYCLKKIIMDGNIEDKNNPFLPKYTLLLDLLPFYKNETNEPVCFDLTFEINNNIYQYKLNIDVGVFNRQGSRKITYESLTLNNINLFERTETLKLNKEILSKKNIVINEGFNSLTFKSFTSMMNNNLEDKKLFLNSDFPSFISKSIFNEFMDFINNKLKVFLSFNQLELKTNNKDNAPIRQDLKEALDEIGVMGSNFMYHNVGNNASVLYSKFETDNETKAVLSEIVESYGTLRFIDLYPAICDSLKNGITLVIDELDTALHPMVVMSILNVYHDPEINKKNAQLIFNTHNPIYLNNKILRRDEMCFVEKNDDKISDFYKMSDFMTNSSNSTRNTTDYINNYFMNKYGAIEFVDLSRVFKKIVE